MIELIRHKYKYFAYEKELAKREIRSLLPEASVFETSDEVILRGGFSPEVINRLVYFAGSTDGGCYTPTLQSLLEQVNGSSRRRQSTRYSAHGIHDYKGKFNPQIVRAILNILNIKVGSRILDPFCGSGTSLLECTHLGMNAIGIDINPLAIFIANAKLAALSIPAAVLRSDLAKSLKHLGAIDCSKKGGNTAREEYLRSWFTTDVLDIIERLRISIEEINSPSSPPLLVVASNLLRDYSLQDPNDLRIRRRKTPLPTTSFISAYEEAATNFIDKLEATQRVLGIREQNSHALLCDSRKITASDVGFVTKFDCALTSPPYATALPYIDTYRLSLVWLKLISPDKILPLETQLVGSREVRGGQSKKILLDRLLSNADDLPDAQADYCRMLQRSLGEKDGFRRHAVPLLLYRYFVGMAKVFTSIRPLMQDGAPFGLIVGGNRTTLGGVRFNIDTPAHLAEIARSYGWTHVETIPLQTYQRYGYHMENAVTTEAMLIMSAA